jgi:hypothetical protein
MYERWEMHVTQLAAVLQRQGLTFVMLSWGMRLSGYQDVTYLILGLESQSGHLN